MQREAVSIHLRITPRADVFDDIPRASGATMIQADPMFAFHNLKRTTKLFTIDADYQTQAKYTSFRNLGARQHPLIFESHGQWIERFTGK